VESGLYGTGQEGAGVEVVRSHAVLEDAHTVRLLEDSRRVRARTILIATGARPELPPFDTAFPFRFQKIERKRLYVA
jgi:glutathione reductase (NADPH)